MKQSTITELEKYIKACLRHSCLTALLKKPLIWSRSDRRLAELKHIDNVWKYKISLIITLPEGVDCNRMNDRYEQCSQKHYAAIRADTKNANIMMLGGLMIYLILLCAVVVLKSYGTL